MCVEFLNSGFLVMKNTTNLQGQVLICIGGHAHVHKHDVLMISFFHKKIATRIDAQASKMLFIRQQQDTRPQSRVGKPKQ